MLIHSYVVRCLAQAVLRQHVAVALALALTLVALLTSLTGLQRGVGVTACVARRACLPSARRVSEACPRRSISGRDKVARASVRISTVRSQIRAAASPQNGQEATEERHRDKPGDRKSSRGVSDPTENRTTSRRIRPEIDLS